MNEVLSLVDDLKVYRDVEVISGEWIDDEEKSNSHKTIFDLLSDAYCRLGYSVEIPNAIAWELGADLLCKITLDKIKKILTLDWYCKGGGKSKSSKSVYMEWFPFDVASHLLNAGDRAYIVLRGKNLTHLAWWDEAENRFESLDEFRYGSAPRIYSRVNVLGFCPVPNPPTLPKEL
jgi:hypothetical protein